MKRTHQALLALAAAGLIFIPACKKATQENPEAPAVQQLAATSVTNWNKEDVNALLTYVPEDTAYIQSSTRAFDLKDPGNKKLLDKAATSIDESITSIQNARATIPPDRPKEEFAEFDTIIDALKSYRDLLKDFENVAPTWGIDSLGRFDIVTYIRDENLVAQMSILDGSKLRDKISPMLNSYLGLIKDKATQEEIKSGNTTWQVYSIKKLLDDMDIQNPDIVAAIPSKLAINYGSTLITAVLISDKFDTNSLEKYLKPADKPFTKEALGKLAPTTLQTGFVDIAKLTKALTSPTGLAILRELNLVEGEATEECINEYNSLAAISPRVNFVADFVGEEFIGKATAVLSDKEELKKISALRTKSFSLATDKSLGVINLNLDIKGTLAYLKSLSAAIEAKAYKCSAVKDLPGVIKEALGIVNNPQIMLFIQGITGLNIVLDKLDLNAQPPVIEAVANLTGPTVGTTAPLLLGLASAGMHEIAKLNLTKGQLAENIDFDFEGLKLKLNGLLTDTDLIYATSTYDVKALSESAKKDANFIDFQLDYALLSQLPSEYSKEFKSLKDYIITFSLSTDDDGITFITKTQFH